MFRIYVTVTSLFGLLIGSLLPTSAVERPPVASFVAVPASIPVWPTITTTTSTTVPAPSYKHGDCSWVEPLAILAGWEPDQIDRLVLIIRRESGCCPNRIGGDRVNEDCEVVKVAEWHHRSDTGLLQINGVHWKQDHPKYHGLICKEMGICTQDLLLDPYLNLRAGRLLWEKAGWSPWDPCAWGPKYADRCKAQRGSG